MSLNQWGLSINWRMKSVIIITTTNNESTLILIGKKITFRQILFLKWKLFLVLLVYLLIGGVFCQWSELWWFKGRKTKALDYLAFLRSCRGCVESCAECRATKRSACFHDNNRKRAGALCYFKTEWPALIGPFTIPRLLSLCLLFLIWLNQMFDLG